MSALDSPACQRAHQSQNTLLTRVPVRRRHLVSAISCRSPQSDHSRRTNATQRIGRASAANAACSSSHIPEPANISRYPRYGNRSQLLHGLCRHADLWLRELFLRDSAPQPTFQEHRRTRIPSAGSRSLAARARYHTATIALGSSPLITSIINNVEFGDRAQFRLPTRGFYLPNSANPLSVGMGLIGPFIEPAL